MINGRKILTGTSSWLRRYADILIPVAILIGAIVIRLLDPAPIQYMRNVTFDTYQRIKPRIYNPDLNVRIAAIDEPSLKKYGQWPWPRDRIAMLINRLHELGAAVISLDVMLIEPDRSSPQAMLEELPATPDFDDARQRIGQLPDNDILLSFAMRRIPVVMAFALTDTDPHRPQAKPAPIGGYAVNGQNALESVFSYSYAITPLPQLAAAAKGLGAANAQPDRDGVFRAVPLVFSLVAPLNPKEETDQSKEPLQTDALVPSLSAETLLVAAGVKSFLLRTAASNTEKLGTFFHDSGVGSIKIGPLITPTTQSGDLLLYDTGHQKDRMISLADIMDPGFDRTKVENAIILIGATVEGLNDIKSSPISPNMPGVEFHAQAIEQILETNLLHERPLIRPYWATKAEILYIVVIGLATIALIRRRGAVLCLLTSAVVIAIAIYGSYLLFSFLRFQVDPIYPSATIFLIFVTGTMINFLRTESEKRQVRGIFSLYLSPVMVDRVSKNPGQLSLGGEIRDLTIMFSDIRGFTKISENLDPQSLTNLMNRYLTPMTSIVHEHHGTIDKYIGDCIMAFWNAPVDVPEHGKQAILAAFGMRAALKELNAIFQEEAAHTGIAMPEIRAGIGLNTGQGCVGNMGSEQRVTYTVLGDTVNTASRLEALSASYGVDLVIGHETAAAAPEFALLELDQVRVKGKLLPVRIFTALGDETVAAGNSFHELRSRHIALLGAYRQCDWDVAAAALAACREVAPDTVTRLYDLYEKRIAEFRLAPPPADWDGVYTATSKAG